MPSTEPTPTHEPGLATRLGHRLAAWWHELVGRDEPEPKSPPEPESAAPEAESEAAEPTHVPTEAEIDRTLDASFPASDPPSWTATGTKKSTT